LLVFYGLGNILGAGIYVLIGEVAGVAGLLSPVSFLLASLLAGFTAFSYAEISSRYPVSAGESVYVYEGFGIVSLSRLVGLLIIFAGITSSAAIVQGFVGYLGVFVQVPGAIIIIVLVLGLASLAAWGITESVRAASLFTLVEILGLLLIIWSGRDALASLPVRIHEITPGIGSMDLRAVFLAALLAFYAYIGFEDMVNVAEEVKSPERNLPVAILAALVISSLLYVLVALVAVLSVPPAELAQSSAPLAYIYEHNTGSSPVLITVIGMLAVINGALIQIIMVSRILYGMARKGWVFARLGEVNPVTQTPLLATYITAVAITVLALTSTIAELAQYTSFLILVVFVMVNAALIRIKRRMPDPGNARVYPMAMPVTGMALSILFIVIQLHDWLFA